MAPELTAVVVSKDQSSVDAPRVGMPMGVIGLRATQPHNDGAAPNFCYETPARTSGRCVAHQQ
jgi:hypothetical protein